MDFFFTFTQYRKNCLLVVKNVLYAGRSEVKKIFQDADQTKIVDFKEPTKKKNVRGYKNALGPTKTHVGQM